MVAGLSSRFGGKPKAFAQVGPNDETLMDISLSQSIEGGAEKVIFIVSKATEQMFKGRYGNSFKGIPISYAIQQFDSVTRDKPWGTADAVVSALDFIEDNEKFIVCNGDDIYGKSIFKSLIDFNKTQPADEGVTIGYKLNEVLSDVGDVNRGIYEIENNYVTGIEETFKLNKANSGNSTALCSQNIFLLTKKHLIELKKKLEEFKLKNMNSRTAECLLPKEINDLIKEKKIKMQILPATEQWYGLTYPDDAIWLKKVFAEKNKIKNKDY
jgi:dTDP-glucose pyrophosphorylase